MKKIIKLCFLLLVAGSLQAQSSRYVSTSNKKTCYWNASSAAFDNCGDNAEYNSLFILNEDETMFTHTTNDMKSAYYVKEKKYLSSCSCYSYSVTSDVGNKYIYILDFDNDQLMIKSLGHKDEADDYTLIFSIKRTWKD